ncbi:hypothetical protein N9Y42_06165 [Mariniblastus sp.]|nr:hypothetical protein [Mariniblastus sp.]
MIAIRYVAIFTLWLGFLAGFCHSTVQAQDVAEKQTSKSQSNSESASKSQANQTEAKPADDADQALVDRLEKYLTGTNWTGNFVMDGKDKLISERYEILSAKKSEFGDKWNLIARIKYGGHDTTIPLPPIEIKFAGKTPVITIDQAFIPGMGTFDARVVIRQGKYAGTWKHGKKGGFMFGTIASMSDEERKAAEKIVQELTEE